MKKIILFTFLVIWLTKTHAQSSSPEIITSSGDTHQGTSMQIDWTLGELAITSLQNSTQQITQGFHQPNYTLTTIEELPKEIGQINVYPNPTSDYLVINLNFDQPQKISTQLLDTTGKIIWAKQSQGQQLSEELNIGTLPNGNYFLTCFIAETSYIQTFKIQKNN